MIGDGLTIRAERTDGVPNGQTTTDATDAAPTIEFLPSSLRFLVIDVDSTDAGVGMSCPPIPFVSTTYLSCLRELLTHDGVLAINVSARDPDMLLGVRTNAHGVFGRGVFLSDTAGDGEEEEEDLNVVVFCTKDDGRVAGVEDGDGVAVLRDLCAENGVTDCELVSDL